MKLFLPLVLSAVLLPAQSCAGGPPGDTTSQNPISKETTPPAWTVTEADIARAEDLLAEMTLEEKVGQLFFVRCPDADKTKDIEIYHPGGYILFADHFKNKTPQSVQDEIAEFQKASKIPLLVGVDEEGGTVVRISRYPAFRSTPFLSPRNLYIAGGFDLIRQDTAEKCRLLRDLGINVNLAPVCDLSADPKDFIYPRAFGASPELTAQYVQTVIETMHTYKIGASLKHFPGYGGNADTHTGIAVDNRPYETFVKADFLPFIAGIQSGAGSVMVSHNIVVCLDSQMPASLSRPVHDILRDSLGYSGVIMTDDLSMDAIRQYADEAFAAVLAVKAGNDMLLSSNYKAQIPAVVKAVQRQEISMEQLEESVLRILLWKIALGLL